QHSLVYHPRKVGNTTYFGQPMPEPTEPVEISQFQNWRVGLVVVEIYVRRKIAISRQPAAGGGQKLSLNQLVLTRAHLAREQPLQSHVTTCLWRPWHHLFG